MEQLMSFVNLHIQLLKLPLEDQKDCTLDNSIPNLHFTQENRLASTHCTNNLNSLGL